MLLAVISDIHSNHIALQACLKEAECRGAEHYLFLGDYVSDFAYPQKTLVLLAGWAEKHPCRFLRGNREEYMAAYRKAGARGWERGSEHGSLLYTYENLTDRDIDWFETLDSKGSFSYPGCPPVFACHGSPRETRGHFRKNMPETAEILRELPESTVVCGHIHIQEAFTLEGKRVVNAGSAGTPTGDPGIAQMALLTGGKDGWKEELLRLPYDVEAAIAEIRESGLVDYAPVWMAMIRHAAVRGEHIFLKVLTRAEELSGRRDKSEPIPESCWEQAAEEFGVTLF